MSRTYGSSPKVVRHAPSRATWNESLMENLKVATVHQAKFEYDAVCAETSQRRCRSSRRRGAPTQLGRQLGRPRRIFLLKERLPTFLGYSQRVRILEQEVSGHGWLTVA